MNRCPSCGAPYPDGATYCGSCGRPIGNAGAPVAPPPSDAASSGKGAKWIILAVVGAGCLVIGIAFAGIFAAILIPNFLDALNKAKEKRTVADMRSISTVLESYRADANVYPSATSASELGPSLSKYGYNGKYVDGWKHPLRYTCLSTGESGCDQYELASPGRDGVFESGPGGYSSSAFDPTDYNSDIVVENGEFSRWPEKKTG